MKLNVLKRSLLSLAAVPFLTAALPAEAPAADAGPKVERHPTVEGLSTAFREIGKKVEPSVVNIIVHKELKAAPGAGRNRMQSPFNDPFFRRFFDQDGDGAPDLDVPDDMPGGEQIGTGSGFIIEVDGKTGFIVTNNHVAGNASEMEITLHDGRVIKNGTLVGADPKTDLALLKIEAENLKPMAWGDSSQMQKGDWVLAFGSPFGYVGSMTHGIISATNRNIGIIRQGYEDFLQVDAPINPGNSGGPLVNTSGEVIGINTAIASRSGGFQGIGFAIPSNNAKGVIAQIKTKGKVTRGWLGVSIASVKEPEIRKVAESFGYTRDNGVFVQQVFPNTPATGKLKRGDIVTKLDGKDMADSSQLRNTVASKQPGDTVKLTVFRDRKETEVEIKLGDQPEDLAAIGRDGEPRQPGAEEKGPESLGMRLGSLSPEMLRRFGLPDDATGALVVSVAPRSLAARGGLRPGDLISEVDGKAVSTPDQARDAIGKGDLAKGVRFYVIGRDVQRFVVIQSSESKDK
jgi:serine protease Do